MPTLHAIIRTDLCEETIVETYTKAEDAAAFMDRQPDGAPFRIAVLGERVEPTRLVCVAVLGRINAGLERIQWPDPDRETGTRAEAEALAQECRERLSETATVYGLVPVEG